MTIVRYNNDLFIGLISCGSILIWHAILFETFSSCYVIHAWATNLVCYIIWSLSFVNYESIVKLMSALLPNCRVLFHQRFPLRTGLLKWLQMRWRIILNGLKVFHLWSEFLISIFFSYYQGFWTWMLMFLHWQNVYWHRVLYQKVTRSLLSPWLVLLSALCRCSGLI